MTLWTALHIHFRLNSSWTVWLVFVSLLLVSTRTWQNDRLTLLLWWDHLENVTWLQKVNPFWICTDSCSSLSIFHQSKSLLKWKLLETVFEGTCSQFGLFLLKFSLRIYLVQEYGGVNIVARLFWFRIFLCFLSCVLEDQLGDHYAKTFEFLYIWIKIVKEFKVSICCVCKNIRV